MSNESANFEANEPQRSDEATDRLPATKKARKWPRVVGMGTAFLAVAATAVVHISTAKPRPLTPDDVMLSQQQVTPNGGAIVRSENGFVGEISPAGPDGDELQLRVRGPEGRVWKPELTRTLPENTVVFEGASRVACRKEGPGVWATYTDSFPENGRSDESARTIRLAVPVEGKAVERSSVSGGPTERVIQCRPVQPGGGDRSLQLPGLTPGD